MSLYRPRRNSMPRWPGMSAEVYDDSRRRADPGVPEAAPSPKHWKWACRQARGPSMANRRTRVGLPACRGFQRDQGRLAAARGGLGGAGDATRDFHQVAVLSVSGVDRAKLLHDPTRSVSPSHGIDERFPYRGGIFAVGVHDSHIPLRLCRSYARRGCRANGVGLCCI